MTSPWTCSCFSQRFRWLPFLVLDLQSHLLSEALLDQLTRSPPSLFCLFPAYSLPLFFFFQEVIISCIYWPDWLLLLVRHCKRRHGVYLAILCCRLSQTPLTGASGSPLCFSAPDVPPYRGEKMISPYPSRFLTETAYPSTPDYKDRLTGEK